jgi:aminodeoxyfutalosine synthase
MSTEELVNLIKQVKRQPIERDTLYKEIRDYSDAVFTSGEDIAALN